MMSNENIENEEISEKSSPSEKNKKSHQIWSSLRSALFVLGTAIVIFAAACNSITWHLQRFWGASGVIWQTLWQRILHAFNGDGFTTSVVGSNFLIIAIYWAFGFLYTLVDLTGKPAFILKYKIQQGKNEPLDKTKLIPVILQVLFNQFVVGIPLVYLLFYLMNLRGNVSGVELPTFHWVLLELVIFVLVEEVGFYYSHRLLHYPAIYKHVHKQHHEWTSPIAITAIYCHPVEHIMSNLIPPMLGPLITGAHTATVWLWVAIVIISTLNAHSGYHFPFFPSPEAHDFHHLRYNQNFGMLGVLDRIHGTDKLFRASKAYERHIMLLSLVPIKQLIPDDLKDKTK